MNCEVLKTKYGMNTPIFTGEIIGSFPDYSRPQVFRNIKSACDSNDLVQYDTGVYFLPTETVFGLSTISADSVAEKKYVGSYGEIYGVYSGIKLMNAFSITSQLPAVTEIVTNNESAKCREIVIGGRRFVLRKSRTTIDVNNAAAYTVLQLFSDLKNEDVVNDFAKELLLEYIKENNVSKDDLLKLAMQFPARTAKKLIGSGILNEIT